MIIFFFNEELKQMMKAESCQCRDNVALE